MPATTQPTSTSAPPTATFGSEQESTLEFEAPLSAELDLEQRLQIAQDRAQQGGAKGRFSIDLSLELERQLANMESPPITPGHDAPTHPDLNLKDVLKGGNALDPHILSHIVTQLRQSLIDMTKERDDLINLLSKANTEQANTKDALHIMTEKMAMQEEELSSAKRKMKEDEDQIVLLRAKVEESRRGLMRLQAESRRQPIDVARASTLSPFGSPPSKRSSFTPLTGSMHARGHRRISSVSDTTFGGGSYSGVDLTPSPNQQSFIVTPPDTAANRRFSGLFGRTSPLGLDSDAPLPGIDSAAPNGRAPSPPAAMVLAAELDDLKKELKSVKDELATAKHDLQEAVEAKEASETCVQVLREFIADNNIGVTSVDNTVPTPVKLPPIPSMTTGEEAALDSKKPATATGWGFKLWGGTTAPEPPKTSIAASPPTASASTSSIATVGPSQAPAMASATTVPLSGAPLSRKLGGFFSSRSNSISSNSSIQPPSRPAPLHLHSLQTNAAATHSTRDSLYSFSDSSSLAEPVSPGSDMHGLGTAGYMHPTRNAQETIMVRDVTDIKHVHTHSLDLSKPLEVGRIPVSASNGDLDGLR